MAHPHKLQTSSRLPFVARAMGAIFAGLFSGMVVSIGIGSALTALNTSMSPLVCPGDVIVPAWEYNVWAARHRGKLTLPDGPGLETRWICLNEASGEAHIAGYRTILTAGTVYGLILACVFFWGLSRIQQRE